MHMLNTILHTVYIHIFTIQYRFIHHPEMHACWSNLFPNTGFAVTSTPSSRNKQQMFTNWKIYLGNNVSPERDHVKRTFHLPTINFRVICPFSVIYTPGKWTAGTWKSPIWKGTSSSTPSCLGCMLIFSGVEAMPSFVEFWACFIVVTNLNLHPSNLPSLKNHTSPWNRENYLVVSTHLKHISQIG